MGAVKLQPSKLYHAEIGIPTSVPVRFGKLNLRYSRHALQAANSDRYGLINLPEVLDTDKAKVIEVEVAADGLVEKVLYRVPHCGTCDLVIAVIPYDSFVKTVWLNKKNDGHKTLNKANYNRI